MAASVAIPRGLVAAVAALMLAGPAVAEMASPAELPPEDYAGQQYVDTKGCLFMRAGPKANGVWIARVTRSGAPMCDNPPSGRRVPVVEEGAPASFDADEPATKP